MGRLAALIGSRVRAVFASAMMALVLYMVPSVARACSVCTAGRDEENQAAFLLSTLFMSLLPLIVIGSVVFFLWRRIQKLEVDETERSQRVPPGGRPERPATLHS